MTLALKLKELGAIDFAGANENYFFTGEANSFRLVGESLDVLGISSSAKIDPEQWTDQEVMGALEYILKTVNAAEDLVNTEEARAAGQRLSSVSVQEGTSIQSDGTGAYRTVTYTVRFRQPVDMQPVGPVLG